MNLDAYLDRIAYRGSRAPTKETLFAVHRAHIAAVPYENLNIHMGLPLGLSEDAFFEQIVTRRRGGWCYMMNGSLSWALRTMGFHVRRVVGGVMRERMGDEALGNHLALIADLDRPYLCDAGLSDALLEPTPLREGAFTQGGFDMSLSRRDDGFWRFHNHPAGGARSFDFTETPVELDAFAERCAWLQTSPESMFVKIGLCVRRHEGRIDKLRDATLSTITPTGTHDHVIKTAREYGGVLRDTYGIALTPSELERLWPKTEERQRAFEAATA